jgi:hypothetical protein
VVLFLNPQNFAITIGKPNNAGSATDNFESDKREGGKERTCAARSPRLKSLEQDVKTFLREVVIIGENVRQSFSTHGLHGDAIRQAIMLIGTGLVQSQGIKKPRPCLWNNRRTLSIQNPLYKGGGPCAKVSCAIEGQTFRQDFIGSIERGIAKCLIECQDTPVPLISVAKEGDPVKRIDEVTSHVGRFGVP